MVNIEGILEEMFYKSTFLICIIKKRKLTFYLIQQLQLIIFSRKRKASVISQILFYINTNIIQLKIYECKYGHGSQGNNNINTLFYKVLTHSANFVSANTQRISRLCFIIFLFIYEYHILLIIILPLTTTYPAVLRVINGVTNTTTLLCIRMLCYIQMYGNT